MRYQVINPDVWGHVSADCTLYDCPCVKQVKAFPSDTKPTTVHDDNACECHEDVNDWFKVGAIDVADDATDDAILDALADGYLTREGRAIVTLDDCNGMGEHLDVRDGEGRLILQLEQVES